MPYRKLLVGIDFSEHSRAALKAAVELAVKFEASLTLLHVTPQPRASPEVATEQVLTQLLTDVAKWLGEWKVEAHALGAARVDTVSVPGVAWSQIVETAKVQGHDGIIVGTHGKSGILGVLIGSVTERVVRHAPCTVMVVKA